MGDEDAGPDLVDLLGQLAAGQLDSSGVFTIDLSKAREKLARFQLALPSFYLLKLVQAAVQVGARAVRISTGKKLVFTMVDPTPDAFPPEEVVAGLKDPASLPWDSPLAHLCSGLLAALGCQPQQLQWSTWRGQAGEVVQAHDEGVLTLPLTKSLSRWRPDQVRFDLTMTQSPGRVPAQEKQAVKARCGYCPIPITLNGFKVSGAYWGKENPFFADAWRLAERYGPAATPRRSLGLARQRGARVDLQGSVRTLGETREDPEQLLLLQRLGGGPYGSAIALFECGDRPAGGAVVWVRHGVACEATTEDLGYPGCLAVVEASDLAVDASSFAMVVNDELRARVAELRASALELCAVLADRLKDIPLSGTANRSCSGATGGGCLGCLILWMAPFLYPILVIAPLVGGFATSHTVIRSEQGWRRTLQARLEDRLSQPSHPTEP